MINEGEVIGGDSGSCTEASCYHRYIFAQELGFPSLSS